MHNWFPCGTHAIDDACNACLSHTHFGVLVLLRQTWYVSQSQAWYSHFQKFEYICVDWLLLEIATPKNVRGSATFVNDTMVRHIHSYRVL